MPGYVSEAPIGVYRSGATLHAIENYEAFLGAQVEFVLDGIPDRPTWVQFEAGATPSGKTVASWGGGQLGTRRLVLAVPACVQGSSWDTEASGANDAHWTALGNTLVSNGLGNTVLRIAREFNGGWYPWTIGWASPAGHSAASAIAGWRHIVSVLRAVPGQEFTFMWNPTIGVQNGLLAVGGVEQAYPGGDYADVIGLDIYDGDWSGIYANTLAPRTTAQQLASFDQNILNCQDGLYAWDKLAQGWGKPLAYPEWGLRLWLDGTVYHGGGDNPLFVEAMAAGS